LLYQFTALIHVLTLVRGDVFNIGSRAESEQRRLEDLPTIDVNKAYLFFNPTSVAKKAADFNEDPDVTLLDKGMGHLVLARISQGPFGSWDLVRFPTTMVDSNASFGELGYPSSFQ
jgi:hypothetical protein